MTGCIPGCPSTDAVRESEAIALLCSSLGWRASLGGHEAYVEGTRRYYLVEGGPRLLVLSAPHGKLRTLVRYSLGEVPLMLAHGEAYFLPTWMLIGPGYYDRVVMPFLCARLELGI